ncbi:ROK family protein [Nonomuraea terrae]|uniref:ROK family protein n=1 Tax=Nonomuraea terrae TaxID=2530383 RepID=UPI0037952D69
MILAIDIGGTKMAAGLVARDGTVVTSRRVTTPQGAGAETLWHTVTDLIAPLSDDVEGVGVGCGGPMAWPEGEVSPLNIPGWRRFPLRARLTALFPGLPVRVHNDAVCLAVAEHWRGAGQGTQDMLGMVVSTGVGGGLILGGRLVHGRTGNAGHIGHVVVEPDGGPRCGCGGHGCLEAMARGPALATWALAQGWVPSAAIPTQASAPDSAFDTPPGTGADRVPSARTDNWTGTRAGRTESPAAAPVAVPGGAHSGRTAPTGVPAPRLTTHDHGARPYEQDEAYREDRVVTARQLAADARAGDEIASRAMRRAGRAIGIAIASATHLCDLDLVTIGGGLSQAGQPLFGPLEEALREHARMGFARRVEVVPAALGQEAGLVGAAALLLAGDTYWPS